MRNLIIMFLAGWGWCDSAAQVLQRNDGIETTPVVFYMTRNNQYPWKTSLDIIQSQREFDFQKPSSILFLNTSDHLQGMFCKMEYRIETKSKLAPRFRLGSLNYTEWMEGKSDFYSRYWK